MPTCVVIGCNTGSGRGEDEKWQTEKLPKCEELKQKWLNQINRKDYEPTSNTRICFKHFHEEDFVPIAHNRDKRGRIRKRRALRPGSIPSLFLSNDPSDESNNYSEEDVKLRRSDRNSSYSMVVEPDIVPSIKVSNNPWDVSDASVFLKYNCPECDYNNQNINEFSDHALEKHVLANTLFDSKNGEDHFTAKIKREKDGVGDGETDDLDEEAAIKKEDYWENENDQSDLPENTEDYKEEPMVTDVDNRDGPNCTASGGVPTGIETSNAPMCVVTGCHFQYNPKSHRWKLYPLPKSEDMKDKWLEKINLPHNVPITDAVVCYKHFHEHDFVPRYKLSKRGHSKLSMGALKATAVPTLHLFSDPANPKPPLQVYKDERIISDSKPKENGWWSCSSCTSQNMFLYFFELVAHWREVHDFNSHLLWYHYDALTLEEHKERDSNLVKNSWSCQVCESGEKYDFKFQLASHWIENHSNPEVTYEVCQWCSEIFVNTVYSGRHFEKFHSGLYRRGYQCSSCQYHFEDSNTTKQNHYEDLQVLEAHSKQFHERELEFPFLCNLCDVRFLIEDALFHHQKVEHANEQDTLKCDQCQSEFFSKATKSIHDMMYHDMPKTESFLCKHCSEVAGSLYEIVKHHQEYHEMQTLPVFLCENCDFHSEKIGETRAHAKTEHGIDYYKPYKCTHCEYTSDWFPKFCHHVKRHIMPQSVICNMCGKVLKSEHSLKYHMAAHHNDDEEKNYVCDICGFRTAQKQNLRRHHSVHRKDRKCPYCDVAARDKNYLELHIDQKHQDIAGELNHICPQCGKGFIFKYSLTKHIWMHKNKPSQLLNARHMKKPNTEKPTCHVCGKQFKNQSRKFLLKKHLLFQHNIDEGAVFCEICPKTVFFSKRNYNKHMEKEHSGKVKEDEQIKLTQNI